MTSSARKQPAAHLLPILAHESLYVGVNVGKRGHVAGFVSNTLLARHKQFEACPNMRFENSREGFRQLIDRIQFYVPLEQSYVLMRKQDTITKPSNSICKNSMSQSTSCMFKSVPREC